MKVVILAGGKGKRLEPYTTILPKPLMPIGNLPVLEILIKGLEKHGFKEIILATGYLSELLMAYFKDGNKCGVKIEYSKEEEPLGTAGPLKQIPNLESAFLVMNGDILTVLDYSKLLAFHKQKKGVLTVAMHQRKVGIDFGVVVVNKENNIIGYNEKPTLKYLVSMGIYIFEPKALDYIKEGESIDFPDLVKRLLKNGEKIWGYLSKDYWFDIGRHDDYKRAVKDFEAMEGMFLGKA